MSSATIAPPRPEEPEPDEPGRPDPPDPERPERPDEEGSLVTEYGLIAILSATVVGLAMKWASGGAIWELFGTVLDRALELVA